MTASSNQVRRKRDPKASARRWRSLLFGATALIAFLTVPQPAAADENSNHGTIKVHDEVEVRPPMRNEPHVSCEFWIEGFNMADDSGTLVFYEWPPTGEKGKEVLRADWTGEAEAKQKGSHFLAGPFNFTTDGHFRVEAFLDKGHPGNEEHFAKAKMFWVVSCAGVPPPVLECPPNLIAVANQDGSVKVTFTPVEGSDGTNVYRAEGDGDFEFLATVGVGESEFVDTKTVVGTTYTYTVTSLFGKNESETCGEATITVIPEFPTPLVVAFAAVAGTLAYAGLTRLRRK